MRLDWKEEVGGDSRALMPDGQIGMVQQLQQREEGVFFFLPCGRWRQEEAGLCTLPCSSPVIYHIVFFPLRLSFQHQTKRNGTRSNCPALQSLTQHTVMHKVFEVFVQLVFFPFLSFGPAICIILLLSRCTTS